MFQATATLDVAVPLLRRPQDNVCDSLSTGHLVVSPRLLRTPAPRQRGSWFPLVCQGWVCQPGHGPEYHDVNPPEKSVTISHSSGRDISHYSVQLVPEPPPTVIRRCRR